MWGEGQGGWKKTMTWELWGVEERARTCGLTRGLKRGQEELRGHGGKKDKELKDMGFKKNHRLCMGEN